MSQPEEPGADNLSAWAKDGIYSPQYWTSWKLKVFLRQEIGTQSVAKKKCLAFKQRDKES